MFRYGIIAGGIAAVLFAFAGRAEAGWVIEQVLRSEAGPGQMHVLIQANKTKNVVVGPDGQPLMAFMVDLDAETVTQVDYQGRRYATATFPEYGQMMRGGQQAMADQMAKALEQVREQMKIAPPEQRQMPEQMLRSQMPQAGGTPQDCREPQTEVRKTGQRATIAGYPAVRHDVLADGKLATEVWIASGITAWREIDPRKLEKLTTEMARAVPSCGPGHPGFPGANDPAWKLAAEGYPVRTVDQASGGATVEVVKAESRSVPAAEFQPPAGFARQTLQEMLGR